MALCSYGRFCDAEGPVLTKSGQALEPSELMPVFALVVLASSVGLSSVALSSVGPSSVGLSSVGLVRARVHVCMRARTHVSVCAYMRACVHVTMP